MSDSGMKQVRLRNGTKGSIKICNMPARDLVIEVKRAPGLTRRNKHSCFLAFQTARQSN